MNLENEKVWKCKNREMRECGNTKNAKRGNAKIRKCGKVEVRKSKTKHEYTIIIQKISANFGTPA